MKQLERYIEEYRRYPKWLKWLLPFSVIILISTLLLQIGLFPDSPISLKNGQYFGKYGAEHNKEDYGLYLWINRTMLVSAITFFISFVSTIIQGKSQINS